MYYIYISIPYQATFINVVRDPVSRFASRYYFNRFGWGLSSGARRQTWKNEAEINQTLDDCVEKKSEECIDALQVMVRYNSLGNRDFYFLTQTDQMYINMTAVIH